MNTSETQHSPKQLMLFWAPIVIGFIALYSPIYYELANTLWATDEQGHGPLILLISLFLIWQKRELFTSEKHSASQSSITWGYGLLGSAITVYVLGVLLDIIAFKLGSQILVLSAIILITKGSGVFKKLLFPILFLIFMLPLPGTVVDALTLPMKIAVSNVTEMILYQFDYPIAREGVILQIGYYKLLVADACAGLHTVFTLEAMGLLYLHLIQRDSFFRNVTLATLIIPISFIANSTRVIILVLITYYYGDEMGQGFIHDFAGFVLFGVALVLIIFVDSLLHWLEPKYKKVRGRFVK